MEKAAYVLGHWDLVAEAEKRRFSEGSELGTGGVGGHHPESREVEKEDELQMLERSQDAPADDTRADPRSVSAAATKPPTAATKVQKSRRPTKPSGPASSNRHEAATEADTRPSDGTATRRSKRLKRG